MESKALPNNPEVEAIVLASLIGYKFSPAKYLHQMIVDLFYKDDHVRIFKAVNDLYSSGSVIDGATVVSALRKNGDLEIVGGPYEISKLISKGRENIDSHILILKEAYIRRKIITDSWKLSSAGFDETKDIFETVDEGKKGIEEINEVIFSHKSPATFQDQIKKSYQAIAVREELFKKGIVSGIPSGIKDLDKVTYGWQKSDFIVMASRPSMGKTALMLQFAKSAAKGNSNAVIFSLEMSSKKLVDRLMIGQSGVESFKFNSGGLSVLDWQKINTGVGELEKLKLTIDDFSGCNIDYIRSRGRLLKSKNECDIILIDYLQLIQGGKNKNKNREQEISEISRGCKAIAKELDVPVIALSQLSRAVETRGGDKRPMLSDLRESGAIEQDADIVIFPYRPAYYKFTGDEGQDLTGIGELIIAKNRDGILKDVPFRHNESMTEFYEFEKLF